ncbi:MAG TPA: RNA polymerase-associated protein RapA [Rudaea sp.]|nr:RNA polymerase-associated protein RapA [Rudaea sp.]
MRFAPGQRWLSTAEPELGLGTLLRIDGRTVQLAFPAAGTVRQYAAHSAPLLRAEFRAGERIRGAGQTFVVERVEHESGGILRYFGAGVSVHEGELDDIQNVSQADARLSAGRVDRNDQFELRLAALAQRARARRSPAWGMMSARVTLLEHQLRVVQNAVSRRHPRVLLADEVGLGKTVEAGLILARLLATGRIARVLIVLPEALVYQWYVELLRRFNLPFAIFDEERCEAIEQGGDGRNPFEDEQLVIADLAFLRDSDKRARQAHAAGWDLLVLDEAHHLAWTPESASPEYRLIEELAATTPGLILLTATPEQLGRSGHFARLRLLDPARYPDLEQYQREAAGYVQLSQIVDKLQSARALGIEEREQLAARLNDDPELGDAVANLDPADGAGTDRLLDALIDRHGTGRAMFRNRRVAIGGFPRRIAHVMELDGHTLDDDCRQHLLAEFASDAQEPPAPLQLNYADDPRLNWLLALLDDNPADKFFLVCRSQAKVLALEEALRTRSGIRLARFHEGMSLVQRDRNAAFFAESDGARLLLCAEIGSEGRNFQFAHHVVLWDLPHDPDLLEQRIGRLDRIGQKHDIHVHCAAFTGTAQLVLLRWYRGGLDALCSSPADGRELYRTFAARLHALAIEHAHGGEEPDIEIDALIAETRAEHERLSSQLQNGRDRLLELANQRESGAAQLHAALVQADADTNVDQFILSLFELFGVHNDDDGQRTRLLDPEYLSTDGFPGLKEGPQRVTFDRAVALAREDVPLLRMDHPMVTGSIDLLLDSELGNTAFLLDDALPGKTVLLQAVFVLDCVAAPALHADRFLPPTPISVVVDTKLVDRGNWQPSTAARTRAGERLIDATRYRKYLAGLVPPMLKRCEDLARERAARQIKLAIVQVDQELGAEHARLAALCRVNSGVDARELDTIDAERSELRAALPRSLLRLDALRFVCSPGFIGQG